MLRHFCGTFNTHEEYLAYLNFTPNTRFDCNFVLDIASFGVKKWNATTYCPAFMLLNKLIKLIDTSSRPRCDYGTEHKLSLQTPCNKKATIKTYVEFFLNQPSLRF